MKKKLISILIVVIAVIFYIFGIFIYKLHNEKEKKITNLNEQSNNSDIEDAQIICDVVQEVYGMMGLYNFAQNNNIEIDNNVFNSIQQKYITIINSTAKDSESIESLNILSEMIYCNTICKTNIDFKQYIDDFYVEREGLFTLYYREKDENNDIYYVGENESEEQINYSQKVRASVNMYRILKESEYDISQYKSVIENAVELINKYNREGDKDNKIADNIIAMLVDLDSLEVLNKINIEENLILKNYLSELYKTSLYKCKKEATPLDKITYINDCKLYKKLGIDTSELENICKNISISDIDLSEFFIEPGSMSTIFTMINCKVLSESEIPISNDKRFIKAYNENFSNYYNNYLLGLLDEYLKYI